VLGDDPASTTYLPEHNILVREIAGDGETDYSTALTELLPTITWPYAEIPQACLVLVRLTPNNDSPR
jgi:hypothetical protein